ncbi:MAG: endonuclease/exonuclease/phosphatase (EEP) superfamily protein YafD, partial [Verrucomicrobiales bacterium]
GGDFNSPAGDRVYFSLRGNFTDSFYAVGTGWGNTVMNRYPVHRIDQIWASSDALVPVRSRAVPTEHSDHRMVVSDYVWK